MLSLYLKATHIVFVVTWFAGLFYIVRLFIYHVEAQSREAAERAILQTQYAIMERRLWNIITTPSMVIAVATGLALAHASGMWRLGWLHVKLALVVGLLIYHFLCLGILRGLERGELRYSSTQLRLWNELATLFLVAIVFLVVVKSSLSMVWGLLGIVGLSLVLMVAIRLYKKARRGAGEQT